MFNCYTKLQLDIVSKFNELLFPKGKYLLLIVTLTLKVKTCNVLLVVILLSNESIFYYKCLTILKSGILMQRQFIHPRTDPYKLQIGQYKHLENLAGHVT